MDIICEVLADDEWIRANAHEHGAEMQAEEMDLHDHQEFDDDTTLNCIELGLALVKFRDSSS